MLAAANPEPHSYCGASTLTLVSAASDSLLWPPDVGILCWACAIPVARVPTDYDVNLFSYIQAMPAGMLGRPWKGTNMKECLVLVARMPATYYYYYETSLPHR